MWKSKIQDKCKMYYFVPLVSLVLKYNVQNSNGNQGRCTIINNVNITIVIVFEKIETNLYKH